MLPPGNIAIFEGDFLDLQLPVTPYEVVAHIPFNITAALVTKLTRAANPPQEISLVIQREAAERITGRPKQTLAALLILPWFDLWLAHQFQRRDFVPRPRARVVLLRFSKREPPLITREKARKYRDFVTNGFTAWKPTIGDAYRSVMPPSNLARLATTSDLDLQRKPSQVSFARWIAFFHAFTRQASAAQRSAIAGAERRLKATQAGLAKQHRTRST